ncbi:MAG: Proprotein convertase in/kexin type 6 [Cyanobacteria bacterium RYN_339]|nr:Proprotein convertase in/kexin type 6 [Cyanobacteria bacterium RYN_339]
MKLAAPFLVALLATACQTALPVATVPSAAADGGMVVRYLPGTPAAARDAIRLAHNVGATQAIGLDAERWTLASAEAAGLAISDLAHDQRVRFAQPNFHRSLNYDHSEAAPPFPTFSLQQAGLTNDPDIGLQWHLKRARFTDAWATTTGKGVIVAVIDSGCDPNHPDLKANLLPLIDEVVAMNNHDLFSTSAGPENFDNRDGHGHGTHVCGIVGAVRGNGIGVSGAAPDVKILPVKVTTSSGDADDATISKGILDAVDNGAQVINLSIGGPEPSPILLDALNYAFNKNVVVVIASGNDSREVNYPAAYNGVISVGAITDKDKVASYSSHGQNLVIVAPGGGAPGHGEGEPIYSTTPTYQCYISIAERKTTNYGKLAGTSMAAPQVTAAAALMLSVEPGLTPAQMRTRLAAGAQDLGDPGFDEYYGYGELDMAKAIAIGRDDGRASK